MTTIRKNWNSKQIQVTMIFIVVLSVFILPSEVYSQPENDIESAQPIKHGISSTDSIDGKNNFHTIIYKTNNHQMKHIKSYRKDKLRRKNHKTISKKYLDPKTVYFDYYPVENIKLNYDSHEDDNVKVTLISDPDKIEKNHKKLRSKRDLSTKKLKRESNYNYDKPNKQFYDREYYSQIKSDHKFAIPGNYYNPISPSGTYLPIRVDGTNTDGTIAFSSRFDGDERLIWSREPVRNDNNNNNNINRNTPRPSPNRRPTAAPGRGTDTWQPNNSQQGTTMKPFTKKKTSPPLIHVAMPSTGNQRNQINDRPISFADRFYSDMDNEGSPVWNRSPNNENERRPTSPPLIHAPVESEPEEEPTPPPGPREPSKCVWAIVSCCSRNSERVRYSCFEEIGCHGVFWDINPCAEAYQRKAIAAADAFFD